MHLPDVVLAYTLRRLGVSPLEAAGHLPGVERTTGRHDVDGIAERYARNQVKMARIAGAFGARFLCVLQANGDITQRATPGRYDRFRERARTYLEREDVAWLDLNDRANVFRPEMFMDPIHLDARGNAAMADVLAPVLAAGLRGGRP